MTSSFKTEVIIIGGGIAGLAIARYLNEEGVPALVLEKDDRIGGRLRASRIAPEAQLGAEFIHGGNRNVIRLLQDLNIKTVDYIMDGGDGRIYAENNIVYRQDSDFSREVESQYELLHNYTGVQDCSVEEYAQSVGVENHGPGFFARARVIRLEAAALKDLSAKGLYNAYRNAGNPDRNYRIVGGFNALTSSLAGDTSYLLKAEVDRIIWKRDRVAVWTKDGALIVAHTLVLTTPVDVLLELSHRCQPQFPLDVLTAIKSLKMGSAAKVLVHVREGEGKWPNFSAYATDDSIQVWWNLKHESGRSLVGFSAGPETWRVGQMSKKEIIKQAVTDLQLIGGKLHPRDILAVEKLIWNQPGKKAYSYIPVGSNGARERLCDSIGDTIWIAGEAAVVAGLAGTLSGAIESAKTVADKIVEKLNHRIR